MAFKKGHKINNGKIRSAESKLKNRLAHLGKPAWNKGLKKQTDKRVLGYANTKKGVIFSPEHLKKLSDSHKGQIPWIKGKHFNHTEEAKRKIGDAERGEKHHNWRGGITNFPYPVNWNNTLKRSIRERDHYTCKLCGELQSDRAFDVHHIDYDKKNCNPENLITLCIRCHTKTSYNRNHWTKFFKNLQSLNNDNNYL